MTELTHARVRRRRWPLAGALAAAVLALAGCSGDPDPVVTPTETATSVDTPTGTPSETVTPEPTETSALPPLPEEATANTPEGAEAFIRYYFDVVNLANTLPQTGLVSQLADPQCISCQNMEKQVSDLQANGWRFRDPPYDVQELSRIGGGPPDVTRFEASVEIVANAYVLADGTEGQAAEAQIVSGIVGAIWEGAKWALYDMELG